MNATEGDLGVARRRRPRAKCSSHVDLVGSSSDEGAVHDGNFTLTFDSGTVSGAAAGTSLTGQPPPLVALLSTTLTIGDGTGVLVGASGVLIAPLGLRTSDLGVDGSINGTIQVPG